MGLTTDPDDPELTHGVDEQPTGQAPTYLVLSAEERRRGFWNDGSGDKVGT